MPLIWALPIMEIDGIDCVQGRVKIMFQEDNLFPNPMLSPHMEIGYVPLWRIFLLDKKYMFSVWGIGGYELHTQSEESGWQTA